MATVDPRAPDGAPVTGAPPPGEPQAGPAPAPSLRLCAFWIAEQFFGLDVALVGEVVEVEYLAPVPRSPAAVLGVFNLRGEPVALLDLPHLLGLSVSRQPGQGPRQVLVLRAEGLVAGLLVDRLEAVVSVPDADLAPAPSGGPAHLLLGFAELEGEPRRTLSVLAPAALLARLRALSFAGDAG
jgi:purine-binding chemotaxis protein CheW